MPVVPNRYRQRGVVLPLLAVGLLSIIGIVGLSVDVGHAFLNKTRLQNSLDSAALRGARTLMLTNDVAAASADAREVFGAHLGGERAGLDTEDLTLQYSDTLVPFVAGGSNPRYVRAAFESFPVSLSFSSVLAGVGESMSIAGTAVAGPVPVGYPGAGETCDIAPLLVCGVAGNSDCSGGRCFGYQVGTRKEYELRFRSGVDNAMRDEEGLQQYSLRIPECGEGSAYYDCVPAPSDTGGPGNYLLHELACADESCIRRELAGSFGACLTAGSGASVDESGMAEPLMQGLMTRFGEHHPSVDPSDYPADVVSTGRTEDVDYWYDRYRSDVASIIAAGSAGERVPYRRVLTVPVMTCQDGAGGQSANTLLGFLCLFLTRTVGGDELGETIYGQFVDSCEASGEQGPSVPALSADYDGPVEIVLYKDPDSRDS